MGRALVAIGVVLLLCFGVLGVVVFASRSENRVAVDSILAEELTRAIAASETVGDPVEIARLTDFDWDELLLVAPDTPRAEISRALGFEFRGDLNYDAESGELLVFVTGDEIRFADYRGAGRFDDVARPIARFTPQTAVFEVRDLVARPTE